MIYGLFGQDTRLKVTSFAVATLLFVRGFSEWREWLWPVAALLLLVAFGEEVRKAHPFPVAVGGLFAIGFYLMVWSSAAWTGLAIVVSTYLVVLGVASGFFARLKDIVIRYLDK